MQDSSGQYHFPLFILFKNIYCKLKKIDNIHIHIGNKYKMALSVLRIITGYLKNCIPYCLWTFIDSRTIKNNGYRSHWTNVFFTYLQLF